MLADMQQELNNEAILKICRDKGTDTDDILVLTSDGNYAVIKEDGKILSFNNEGNLITEYSTMYELENMAKQDENARVLLTKLEGDNTGNFEGYMLKKQDTGSIELQPGRVNLVHEQKIDLKINLVGREIGTSQEQQRIEPKDSTISKILSKNDIESNNIFVQLPKDRYALLKSDGQVHIFSDKGECWKIFESIEEIQKKSDIDTDVDGLYKALGSGSKQFEAYRAYKDKDGEVLLKTGIVRVHIREKYRTEIEYDGGSDNRQPANSSLIKNSPEEQIYRSQGEDSNDVLIIAPSSGYALVKDDGRIYTYTADGKELKQYANKTELNNDTNKDEKLKAIYEALGGDEQNSFSGYRFTKQQDESVLMQLGESRLIDKHKLVLKFRVSQQKEIIELNKEQIRTKSNIDSRDTKPNKQDESSLKFEFAESEKDIIELTEQTVSVVYDIYSREDGEPDDILVETAEGRYALVKTDGKIQIFNSKGRHAKTYNSFVDVSILQRSSAEAREVYVALGEDTKSFEGYKAHFDESDKLILKSGIITLKEGISDSPDTLEREYSNENEMASKEVAIINIFDGEEIEPNNVLVSMAGIGYALVKADGGVVAYDEQGKQLKQYANKTEIKENAGLDEKAGGLYQALGGEKPNFIGYRLSAESTNDMLILEKGTGTIENSVQTILEFTPSLDQNTTEEEIDGMMLASNAITMLYNGGGISADNILVMMKNEGFAAIKADGTIVIYDKDGRKEVTYNDIKEVEEALNKKDENVKELVEVLGGLKQSFIAYKIFEEDADTVYIRRGLAYVYKEKSISLSFSLPEANENFNNSFIETGIPNLQNLIDWINIKYPELNENITVVRGIASNKAIHYFMMIEDDNKLLYMGTTSPEEGLTDSIYVGEVYVGNTPDGIKANNNFRWGELEDEERRIVEGALDRVFSMNNDLFEEIKSRVSEAKTVVDQQKAEELLSYITRTYPEMIFAEFVTNSSRHIFATGSDGKMRYISSLVPNEGVRYKDSGYKIYVKGEGDILYTDGNIHTYEGFDLASVQKKISSATHFVEIMQSIEVGGKVERKLKDIIKDIWEGEFLWVTNGPQNYILSYSGGEKYEYVGSYHRTVTYEELQPLYTLAAFKVVKGRIQVLREHKNMSIEDELMFIDSMENYDYEIVKQFRLEGENCKNIRKELENNLEKIKATNPSENDRSEHEENIKRLNEDIEIISQRIEECSEKLQGYLSQEIVPMVYNDYSLKVSTIESEYEVDAKLPPNLGIGDAVSAYEDAIKNLEKIRRQMLIARRKLSERILTAEEAKLKKEFEDLKREYNKHITTVKSLKAILNSTKRKKKTNFDHL